MKQLVKNVIKKQIEKVKANEYNCTPYSYYKPKKPSK